MDSGQKKERLHFSQELINIFDVSGTCVKKGNQRNCGYQEERKKVVLSMFRCRQHRQGAEGIAQQYVSIHRKQEKLEWWCFDNPLREAIGVNRPSISGQ